MQSAILEAATDLASFIAKNGPQSVDLTMLDGRKLCGKVHNVLADIWRFEEELCIDVILRCGDVEYLVDFQSCYSFITCTHTVD